MGNFKIGDMVKVRRMSTEEFRDSDTGKPKAGLFGPLTELSGGVVTVLGFSTSNILCKSSLSGETYWFSPNWLTKNTFKGNK